ncbi:MAG: hypothetical protein ABIE92_09440, partial [bacterium]
YIGAEMKIELVCAPGCGGARLARENLDAALRMLDCDLQWSEVNLQAADLQDFYRQFGSPTILINGSDMAPDRGPSAGGT